MRRHYGFREFVVVAYLFMLKRRWARVRVASQTSPPQAYTSWVATVTLALTIGRFDGCDRTLTNHPRKGINGSCTTLKLDNGRLDAKISPCELLG